MQAKKQGSKFTHGRPIDLSPYRNKIPEKEYPDESINIKYQSNLNIANKGRTVTHAQGIRNHYITLTTTPSRFYTNDLLDVLSSLSHQSMEPTKIYLCICDTYVRKFKVPKDSMTTNQRIAQIKNKFPLVEVIRTKDYEPATKLLGLLEYNISQQI